jgi:hypothetical protein
MTPDFAQFRLILAPMGPRSLAQAFQSFRQATLAQIEDRLGKFLSAGLLAKTASKEHSRDRSLPLDRTFWCWLWQILQRNTCCKEVVQQVATLFALHGKSLDEGTSAYCQSRKNISLSLVETIHRSAAQSAQRLAPDSPLLRGRRLKALDGTSVRLADTQSNQKAFPQPCNQKPGAGFPVMKIVALFCVGSAAILAHATGSLSTSEISLAAKLMLDVVTGDVLVADRGYCNYALAAWLNGRGVSLISRVPTAIRHIDFRQGQRLGFDDALFVWKKGKHPCAWMTLAQWLALPETLTVRVLRVRVKCPGSRVKVLTLMTTLLDPALYPAGEIAEAYRLRWRQEMCFDDLKTTLHMAHLKCRSPAMARKELGMFLIAHNLLRCLMAQAAAQAHLQIRQISFKATLDGFRQAAIGLTLAKSKAKREAVWEQFMNNLAAGKLPDRPGRIEPRAVKRIIKYPKLNTLRCRYKDRWSRNKRRNRAREKMKTLI